LAAEKIKRKSALELNCVSQYFNENLKRAIQLQKILHQNCNLSATKHESCFFWKPGLHVVLALFIFPN